MRTLVGLLLSLSAAAPVWAGGDADAVRGLVADRCARCHLVPGYSTEGLPTVNAPPFQKIADEPDTYTEARIRTFLLKRHWPMQQMTLSPRDIDNLLAYFATLRRE